MRTPSDRRRGPVLKSDPLPPEFSEWVESCKKLLTQGGTTDPVLKVARSKGYSKILSIRLLVDVMSIVLGQAKRIVHDSAVWSDRKEQDERLHDILRRVEG